MRFFLIFLLLAGSAHADTVLAARTIRSQSILTASDVTIAGSDLVGAFTQIDDVLGLEARVVLYAGRPIRHGDVGPPAIIERNQIITLVYETGGLAIATEARALARAGVGDRVRVMNLNSRTTVTGTVQPDGSVSVSPVSLRTR